MNKNLNNRYNKAFTLLNNFSFRKIASHLSGFTLIELLVVIAIVGLISSLVFVSLNETRARAIDAKRIAEADAIKKALVLYHDENGHYPKKTEWASLEEDPVLDTGESFSQAMSPWLPVVPKDPLYPKEKEGGRIYSFLYKTNDDATEYKLHIEMQAGDAVSYEVSSPGGGDIIYPPIAYVFKRGVNIAGGEFETVHNEYVGTHGHQYWFNTEPTFEYFVNKKLDILRVATRWERIQPVLSGPLNEEYIGYIKNNILWAKNHGGQIILDIHNYGRYKMKVNEVVTECIIDKVYDGEVRVTSSDFADLWARLSDKFKDEPGVYAYGLMNEPHDMGGSDWKAISQDAVTSIRNNNDSKLIMVPGNGWSSAGAWEASNGSESWITDSEDNFKYEAHCYFDRTNSGAYTRSYDEELAYNSDFANLGYNRLSHFVNWCEENNVRGYLGEYGVPNEDPRWYEVNLKNFLELLDDAKMDGTYWAAGEWWGAYRLSIQPTDNFTVDRVQLPVLSQHLGSEY